MITIRPIFNSGQEDNSNKNINNVNQESYADQYNNQNDNSHFEMNNADQFDQFDEENLNLSTLIDLNSQNLNNELGQAFNKLDRITGATKSIQAEKTKINKRLIAFI